MSDVILDSSFVVAELDSRDLFHDRALSIRQRISKENLRPILLDLVVNETLTVIAKRWERSPSRGPFSKVFEAVGTLIRPENVVFVYPRLREYWEALMALFSSADGRLSFHDGLILLVMKEQGIQKIATFDDDFKTVKGISVLS